MAEMMAEMADVPKRRVSSLLSTPRHSPRAKKLGRQAESQMFPHHNRVALLLATETNRPLLIHLMSVLYVMPIDHCPCRARQSASPHPIPSPMLLGCCLVIFL